MPACICIQKQDTFDLKALRTQASEYLESLRVKEGPYGVYRESAEGDIYSSVDVAEIREHRRGNVEDLAPEEQWRQEGIGLYPSLDAAIMRQIMGERLRETLAAEQRQQWTDYINSYLKKDPADGSYTDTYGHSPFHANGMVISALGAIGGKQVLPVKMYEQLNTAEKMVDFLENKINWANQWPESHLFWGGMLYFSFSKSCPEDWLPAVINWLNANADPATGKWRKGTVYTDENQWLGGMAHIIPLYDQHGLKYPYARQVIDQLLAMQLPNGRWLHRKWDFATNYLDLDALYIFKYMQSVEPEYRKEDVRAAINRYADFVIADYREDPQKMFRQHPHQVLAAISIFGLFQYFEPERFVDKKVKWSDIFSDPAFHLTAEVECLQ